MADKNTRTINTLPDRLTWGEIWEDRGARVAYWNVTAVVGPFHFSVGKLNEPGGDGVVWLTVAHYSERADSYRERVTYHPTTGAAMTAADRAYQHGWKPGREAEPDYLAELRRLRLLDQLDLGVANGSVSEDAAERIREAIGTRG